MLATRLLRRWTRLLPLGDQCRRPSVAVAACTLVAVFAPTTARAGPGAYQIDPALSSARIDVNLGAATGTSTVPISGTVVVDRTIGPDTLIIESLTINFQPVVGSSTIIAVSTIPLGTVDVRLTSMRFDTPAGVPHGPLTIPAGGTWSVAPLIVLVQGTGQYEAMGPSCQSLALADLACSVLTPYSSIGARSGQLASCSFSTASNGASILQGRLRINIPIQVARGTTSYAAIDASFVAQGDARCPTDWDGDSTVNLADLLAYFDEWSGQNGLAGPSLTTDIDGSFVVDLADLLTFFDSWSGANGLDCP